MAASALTLSPPSFDYAVNPGDKVVDALTLHNESLDLLTISVEAQNFSAVPGDETEGIPDLYPASEVRDGRGLGPWLSFPIVKLTLKPGERGVIPFEIAVPSDASPGSHFGAILLTTSAGAGEGAGVGVVSRAAALVLLKVQGDVVEDLALTGFASDRPLYASLPARFEARLENKGTVHARPFGTVVIRDLFGRQSAVLDVNRLEYKSVLPGGARRFAATWTRRELPDGASALERQLKNFAFGRYTAELTMQYGLEGKTLTAATTFWVLPWLAIAAGGLGLILLALLLKLVLGRYRKMIIRQYQAEQEKKDGM